MANLSSENEEAVTLYLKFHDYEVYYTSINKVPRAYNLPRT